MLDLDDDKRGLIEHLGSLAEMKGRMLPLPTELFGGESLRDAVFRASGRNGFENTWAVIDLAKSRSFRSANAVPAGALDDIDRLVDVLGIRKNSKAAREILSQTATSGRDWINFFGTRVRRGHISGARRVSPRSLRLHCHQKAMWSLKPFNFDPGTMEKLLDHCPVCELQLGWSRSFGVAFCDSCTLSGKQDGAVDLRDYPQPLIEVEDDKALQFVTGLVDPERVDSRNLSGLHCDLANRNRGELFQFAIQLAGFYQRARGNRGALEASSTAAAGRALLGWPVAFDRLVNVSRSGSDRSELGHADAATRLHYNPTLSAPIRHLLKQRCDGHLNARIAQRQAVGTEVRYGFATTGPLRHSRIELIRLARERAPAGEVAVKLLRAAPEGKKLSALLGLPIPFLVDLYDEGMLPELLKVLGIVRRPVQPHWKTSLTEILSDLPVIDPGNAVPLAPLSLALAHMDGVRWTRLFRTMKESGLVIARSTRKTFDVRNLYVTNIGALQEALSESRGASVTNLVPLRLCEAALSVGVSQTTIRMYTTSDALPRNPSIKDIGELRKDWMLASEIRTVLRLHDRSAPQRFRSLEKSGIARQSAGETTLWSRVGVCESLGLEYRFTD